jgi:ubiquitin-like protein UBact
METGCINSDFGFRACFVIRHSCFVICCPGLPFQYLLLDFFMPERIQKPVEPAPWGPKQGDGGGPRSPDVSRPDTKDLLKKMRKVDPNQSKRYRQRTGQ